MWVTHGWSNKPPPLARKMPSRLIEYRWASLASKEGAIPKKKKVFPNKKEKVATGFPVSWLLQNPVYLKIKVFGLSMIPPQSLCGLLAQLSSFTSYTTFLKRSSHIFWELLLQLTNYTRKSLNFKGGYKVSLVEALPLRVQKGKRCTRQSKQVKSFSLEIVPVGQPLAPPAEDVITGLEFLVDLPM